jgi:hypothetical protein
VGVDERVANHVDSFLVEALDNPRHRLMGTCHSPPHLSIHPLAVSFAAGGARDFGLSASLGVRAYTDVIPAAGPRGRAVGFRPEFVSRVRACCVF